MFRLAELRTAILSSAVLLTFGAMAPANAADVYDGNITEAEVLAAQQGWCEALLAISATHAAEGQPAAHALAGEIIDAAYGYGLGPVLFKPTLTVVPQTFRTTREGALAYFAGDDPDFPSDYGFALSDWKGCEIRNAAIHINGDLALTMGNVDFTDGAGATTSVDKTWAFKKMNDGSIRIVLHHSSLPHTAN